MSYTINHYNGRLITTVADGTIDTSLDVTLVGKNYAGYGKLQNENFVYLLENFANSTQPPGPVAGQIWFDSGNSKLKFFDGNKFRITSGAETGATPPSGLTQGDFWFNTTSNQLYAYTGSGYTLVGPQAVTGSATTQMQSVSVKDSVGGTHAIIQAIDNGQTVFTISTDSEFRLDDTINPITGFTYVRQGLTLAYTNDPAQAGVTTDGHRFWGTATNADKLGGLSASNFVQAGSAAFSTVVNFADVGYTVGNPIARLKVFNDGATTPTILNQTNDTIVFQTTVAGITETPLKLVGLNVMPGNGNVSNIGSASFPFASVYANYVYSTAAQSDALNVGGSYRVASIATTPNTLVSRDASSNINANNVYANYVYSTTSQSDALNVGGTYRAAGTASAANTIVARDASANIYANYVYSTAAQSDALNVGGSYRTASVASAANTVVVRDASSNINANLFQGTATSANYADLAEKYLADAEYVPGTVVCVGGDKEVTAAGYGAKAIGVVSTNPAYMMNSELEGGTYIALKGRVPTLVWGTVVKGDLMVPTGSGYARAAVDITNPGIFAVALESSDDAAVKLIECVIL